MKGVFAIPGKRVTSVHFDGMTWPLPEIELFDRLQNGPRSAVDCRVAASIIRAYVRLIFAPARKRRRVVAALRSAREKGERDG
jgi:hypothetical protein